MNTLIKKLLSTRASIAITLLRVVTGLTFASHGSQKLFAWFGGYGLEGTGQWMESIGIHPGYLMAALAGSAEFFGGLALVIGLLVRPAAAALLFAMLVAIFTAHWSSGFFISNGGFEYAMILALISAVLIVEGAGKLSLDRRLAN
ncbi:DoxX family protein [Pseudomonas sp. LRF_L74]|uniref:DoxX family protein n=1 Tax=Pseudomonas sp. LRF_L74 TaxID=3369422 RepID=UPI003F601686